MLAKHGSVSKTMQCRFSIPKLESRCALTELRKPFWPPMSVTTHLRHAELTRCPMCTQQGVQGISDIITIPGLVNVDFADVKAIMCNSGTAMLGVGVATGKNRAEEAALVRPPTTNLLLPSLGPSISLH